ncbi:hypothetical protein [Herbaspirillum sp.]|uniref:hypothetical protein n=1 Tax=Herbaspirillum sp. TaxID=1890675 RepID=UPI00257E8136|nr:hypothetical protein [Herbaspirillum sp.]
MGYMQPGTEGVMERTRHQEPEPEPEYTGPMRGLGDMVHKVLEKTGVAKVVKRAAKGKDCGCAARRKALNKAVPFSKG